MMGIQLPQAKVVAGRLQDRFQRCQADELGRLYRGAELGRSPDLEHVYAKLDVRSKSELIRRADQLGI